jgi:MFS family permease
MLSLGLQIVGLAVLMSSEAPLVWIFTPIFGFGFGSLGAIMPLLVQETFGLRAFGTIFGTINLFTLIAALIGPPLVGLSFDELGSYRPAFIVICVLFVVAAALISFTRPLQRIRRQRTGRSRIRDGMSGPG